MGPETPFWGFRTCLSLLHLLSFYYYVLHSMIFLCCCCFLHLNLLTCFRACWRLRKFCQDGCWVINLIHSIGRRRSLIPCWEKRSLRPSTSCREKLHSYCIFFTVRDGSSVSQFSVGIITCLMSAYFFEKFQKNVYCKPNVMLMSQWHNQ